MMNRVAIYARLSREDEYKIDGNKESKSIENQIKVLSQYAFEHNFEVADIYYDDGYSGANLDRPGIQRLLKDMKSHKFNIVLVKDISRLGRCIYQVGDLIDIVFPTNNIRLISVNDRYDSSTYNEDGSIVLRNFLNDFYLKDFKKKCRNSMKHRARTKHLASVPKFGYRFDDEGNELIDDYSSHVVRKIFNYVGNLGYSLAETARRLNDEGIMTRSQYESSVIGLTSFKNREAKEWDRHSVNDVARDYEYCGHSINLVRHKKEDRILLKNTHKAIIDEDLFLRTQDVIKSYRKVGRNGIYNHIGPLLRDKTTGNGFVYCPPRPSRHAKACYTSRGIKGSINAEVLHKVLFRDCLEMIDKCKNKHENIFARYKNGILNGSDTKKLKLKQTLENHNIAYSKLLESYFSNNITKNLFEKKSLDLQRKIKDLEEQLNNCDEAIERLRLFEIRFSRFINELKDEPQHELDIIRQVIAKVYINKIVNPNVFDITIVYKFEDN